MSRWCSVSAVVGPELFGQQVVLQVGQHRGELLIFFGRQPCTEGVCLLYVVQVAAQKFDHAVLAQPPRHLFGTFAVVAGQRENIHLEVAPVVVQVLIDGFVGVVIAVPFGVCQDGLEPFEHELKKDFVEVDGCLHERVFDQKALPRQRSVARAAIYYPELLIRDGRPEEAEALLDQWYVYPAQLLGSGDLLISMLIVDTILELNQKKLPELYARVGKPEKGKRIAAKIAESLIRKLSFSV